MRTHALHMHADCAVIIWAQDAKGCVSTPCVRLILERIANIHITLIGTDQERAAAITTEFEIISHIVTLAARGAIVAYGSNRQ